MFPDAVGEVLERAVKAGADPKVVVPDSFVVARGGSTPIEGTQPFSAAIGPSLQAAASALPHGQIRVTTAGAIRAAGGMVEWAPETSRHGTVNRQHVNITGASADLFSDLMPNPVPRRD